LEFKITLIIFVIVFGITLINSSMYLIVTNNSTKDKLHASAEKVLNLTKPVINSEKFNKFTVADDEKTSDFIQMKNKLNIIREYSNSYFLYTMRKNAQGEIIYVVDGLGDNEEASHIGDKVEVDLDLITKVLDGTSEEESSNIKLDKQYGYPFYSVYMPIKDASNSVIGAVAVDYNCEKEYAMQKTYLSFFWLSIFISAILSLAGGMWVSKRISRRIILISKAAEKAADFDLTGEEISIKNNATEINLLATSFNRLKENNKKLINKLD
jgi:methyl-accepting chemotaxis protein